MLVAGSLCVGNVPRLVDNMAVSAVTSTEEAAAWSRTRPFVALEEGFDMR